MFIRNKANETMNLEYVTHVRVYGDRAPYEIHVFSDNNRLVFLYDNEKDMKDARHNLLRALHRTYPRWIEIESPEYHIRADKVKHAMQWQNAIKLMFENSELILYPNLDISTEEYLTQITESLSAYVYDQTALLDI